MATLSLFDSHSHLHDPAFDDDRDEALVRAHAAGVRELVVVGSDPEDAGRAKRLAGRAAELDSAPAVWWTAGLHPHEARRWSAGIREALIERLAEGAVAVGETGLDYHYDNSPREEQRKAFAAQLAIAAERELPVVIHSRDAEDETLAVLADSDVPPERIVLHCFTGSPSMLETAVARGCHVSFSGIATFASFPAEDLVPRVPHDRLLAETDAPYLAPVPHRGKRNEPAFVVETVRRLAEIRGEPLEETARLTRENARRFYEISNAEDRATPPPRTL